MKAKETTLLVSVSIIVADHELISLLDFSRKSALICKKIVANKFYLVHASKILFRDTNLDGTVNGIMGIYL
jgi:hypothetical protein